jgi:hypothetical protein
MKKILLVTAVVLLLCMVLFGLISRKAKKDDAYTITAGKTTVIKELRALNRLETAQFTIEKVIDAGTSGSRFQEILFGDRILLIAHGEVIAGFDMSKLDADDIVVEGNSITMTLPAPQILVTNLNNEQTRVYDRRQGFLTKGDKDLESAARKAAEDTIRQAACEGGILSTASENGKKQLTVLLKSLQFTSVQITVGEGSC